MPNGFESRVYIAELKFEICRSQFSEQRKFMPVINSFNYFFMGKNYISGERGRTAWN